MEVEWPLSYVSVKETVIGSDNDLSPLLCQAIIWTKCGLLLIRPLGTSFSEILITKFSFNKVDLKMSAKWHLFSFDLSVLMDDQLLWSIDSVCLPWRFSIYIKRKKCYCCQILINLMCLPWRFSLYEGGKSVIVVRSKKKASALPVWHVWPVSA